MCKRMKRERKYSMLTPQLQKLEIYYAVPAKQCLVINFLQIVRSREMSVTEQAKEKLVGHANKSAQMNNIDNHDNIACCGMPRAWQCR